MTCKACAGTGSLSKDLHGDLDCIYCDAADQRTVFNAWVRANVPGCDLVDAWVVRQYVMSQRPAVTRYTEEWDYNDSTMMVPSEDGEWVRYEDVKHLLAGHPA